MEDYSSLSPVRIKYILFLIQSDNTLLNFTHMYKTWNRS